MELHVQGSLLAILTASLIGSLHCAGMCGGFVAIYNRNQKPSLSRDVAYSFGRLLSYLFLGTLAYYFGTLLTATGSLFGLPINAPKIIGLLLVVWGILQLIGYKSRSLITFGISKKASSLLAGVVRYFSETHQRVLPFIVGFGTVFLPCGWLYTYLAVAASSPSLSTALLSMSVFWGGTLPIMLSLGQITSSLLSRSSTFIPRITALLIILAGIFSLATAQSHSHHHHGSSTTTIQTETFSEGNTHSSHASHQHNHE